jgi:ribosome-binding factor A
MSQINIKAAQLADQIRDYIATWISRDFPGSFLSVTQVTLSIDRRHATVWISSYNDNLKILEALQKREKEYQRELSRAIKRFSAPTIHFSPDTSTADAEHIDSLLK